MFIGWTAVTQELGSRALYLMCSESNGVTDMLVQASIAVALHMRLHMFAATKEDTSCRMPANLRL